MELKDCAYPLLADLKIGSKVPGVGAPRAQKGVVCRRRLAGCVAVQEMKDLWPFGVALRGVASNRLMVH